ncbi:MAG: hypothetical protein JNJ54_19290 [Myxococcaceae bacterium]|nr:hypothetical protein [Myxococcaceae bacterium]
MRTLIMLVWTVSCVGVGIAAATVDVGGRTPWEHARKAWHSEGEKRVGEAKEHASEFVDDVKKKVTTTVKDAQERPLDRHSASERDALDKLIANRQRDPK